MSGVNPRGGWDARVPFAGSRNARREGEKVREIVPVGSNSLSRA